jgi:GntR family transcriptional regulator
MQVTETGQVTETDGGPVPSGRGAQPFQRIAADLREKIVDGELAPGTQLPTETELAAQYGVARTTVRAGLAELAREGLIESVRPRGHFVRDRTGPRRVFRDRAVYRDERGYYFDPAAKDWVAVVPPTLTRGGAPADVAEMLGVEPGEQVVVRDRQIGEPGGPPLQLATSYLPADLVAGTPLGAVDTGPGGIYARLEDMGLTLTWGPDIVSARMPTPGEADLLQLPTGVPLLRICRATRDQHGRVWEVNDTRMNAELFAVAYPLNPAPDA